MKGISFSVSEGDFLGIIGPNGAGKSTLFRAIMQILKSWEGEIIYKGRDISGFSTKDLAKEVAAMPQLLDVSPSFSVREFVLMGRFPHLGRFERLKSRDLEIARKAMGLTDTLSLGERRVIELSGGERQRVILAQALAQEPHLLLLDEPTAHLDIGHQVDILDLVRTLNREMGITVVVVMHDLNLASEYCHRLILLKDGVIFKLGKPNEVLTYQILEEVYETVVVTGINPVSSKPHIFLVPKERLRGEVTS